MMQPQKLNLDEIQLKLLGDITEYAYLIYRNKDNKEVCRVETNAGSTNELNKRLDSGWSQTLTLNKIIVHEEFRGNGLFKRAMADLENLATKNKFNIICLQAYPLIDYTTIKGELIEVVNELVNKYKDLGYEIYYEEYCEANIPVIFMKKELTNKIPPSYLFAE